MIEINVCVGSSCHLKGSYDIIKTLERLIEINNLKNDVVLKATFCMGQCTEGVAATINGVLIKHLNRDNAKDIFEQHILRR